MSKENVDLRYDDWREAIIKIATAMEEIQLTDRALSLLIADTCGVKRTEVRKVLAAIPELAARYLK